MSLPSNKKAEEDKTLYNIENWLLSNGFNPRHFAAMRKFAGRRTVATKREWKEIFAKY